MSKERDKFDLEERLIEFAIRVIRTAVCFARKSGVSAMLPWMRPTVEPLNREPDNLSSYQLRNYLSSYCAPTPIPANRIS